MKNVVQEIKFLRMDSDIPSLNILFCRRKGYREARNKSTSIGRLSLMFKQSVILSRNLRFWFLCLPRRRTFLIYVFIVFQMTEEGVFLFVESFPGIHMPLFVTFLSPLPFKTSILIRKQNQVLFLIETFQFMLRTVGFARIVLSYKILVIRPNLSHYF